MENQNNVTEFVFLGLWEDKQLQLLFCFLFLLSYLVVLMGNFIILLTITCSTLAEQPVYYFLCQLSLMNLSFTSVVIPQLIRDLVSERKIISYNSCMTQLFTMYLLAAVEIFILVSMAFDHYVAIVNPLHYMVIMNWQRYNMLIIMAWSMGFCHSIALLFMVLNLPFCGPNQINNSKCDVKPLLKLVCKDMHVFSVLVIINSGISGVLIFPVPVASYISILYSLRTHTSSANCSSHIIFVILFFVPCDYLYIFYLLTVRTRIRKSLCFIL